MTKCFLSYRREDTADITGRIYDCLVRHYGAENVFQDVDSIPPGVDFRKQLSEAVGRCQVLLAVIGRQWLTVTNRAGKRRLDDARDFVRIEIEAALQRDIPVIPMLVQGVEMPAEEDLPPTLQPLAYRNAITVNRDPHFHRDLDRLINHLDRWFAQVLSQPSGPAAVASLEPSRAPTLGSSAQEQHREMTDTVEMKLALIPPGKFLMGSPQSEEGRDKDEAQHEVAITQPFYLGVHAVTVGQFRAFVKAKGYQTEAERDGSGAWGYNARTKKFESGKEFTWNNPGWRQSDDHPVVNVTWNDAVAFCEWLSDQEGVKYRLPTEAEWEYSCRAGTTTRFYSGDKDDSLKGVANLADASFKQKHPDATWAVSWDDGYPFTAPAGRFKPNAFGLYDMHGNVWEWCADWYDENYYKESPKQDPPGPSAGAFRVVRGGSFNNDPGDCRAADRFGYAPDNRNCRIGFRAGRVLFP
jgi:formylglycine-generating enzyme required for sulfatase activity